MTFVLNFLWWDIHKFHKLISFISTTLNIEGVIHIWRHAQGFFDDIVSLFIFKACWNYSKLRDVIYGRYLNKCLNNSCRLKKIKVLTNLSINCCLFLAQIVIAMHAFQPGEQILRPDQLWGQNECLKFPPEFFFPVRTLLAPDGIQVGDGQLGMMKLDLGQEGVIVDLLR